MKPIKITRALSFQEYTEFGKEVWDKITIESELEEGDNPKDCLKKLKETIQETHNESFPQPLKDEYHQEFVQIEKVDNSILEELKLLLSVCPTVFACNNILQKQKYVEYRNHFEVLKIINTINKK